MTNFHDFNVVIGSNASGKSNLVQIFKLIKDIEEYGLENAISLQGCVEYFINNQIGASEDFSREIEFSSQNTIIQSLNHKANNVLCIDNFVSQFSIKFNSLASYKYRVTEDKIIYHIELGKLTDKDRIINNQKKILDMEVFLRNQELIAESKIFDEYFLLSENEEIRELVPENIGNLINNILSFNSEPTFRTSFVP